MCIFFIYVYILYFYIIYGSFRSKIQITVKENIYLINPKLIRSEQFPHTHAYLDRLKASFIISCTD